ncbi:hypothetical protein BKK80_34915 (plasmid) [Cupriavidus malaysiensis]|uniref:DUF202 domain-containing protein n=2 Tax=Cupriavidus malaysiensis TaxID=367825 RepID=A0ABM6FGR3_9BURK|nr:hypothetical protein BKK80_34915 [Cupriavidus malaysiensis]
MNRWGLKLFCWLAVAVSAYAYHTGRLAIAIACGALALLALLIELRRANRQSSLEHAVTMTREERLLSVALMLLLIAAIRFVQVLRH